MEKHKIVTATVIILLLGGVISYNYIYVINSGSFVLFKMLLSS